MVAGQKLIEQLLQNWGKVNLFTRPRRFGKTLEMFCNAFIEKNQRKLNNFLEIIYGIQLV